MDEKKLKRDPVKYIRDFMKSSYKARECCFICRSRENIELHHLYSVAELWHAWSKKNRIIISSDEDIINCRDRFVQENALYLGNEHLYSLCKSHHQRLHSIYGKSYSNYMARKVKNWLEAQRDKAGEI
jgi:hypothetical protein